VRIDVTGLPYLILGLLALRLVRALATPALCAILTGRSF